MLHGQKMKKLKPNLFVVGAPKSGTTALFYILNQHKDVFFPNPKELNFFQGKTGIEYSKHYNDIKFASVKEYEQFFVGRNEKIIGDGSVSYLADSESPELIAKYNPDAKIIICVRNPVDRAFSHYLMDKALGLTKEDFGKIIMSDDSALKAFKYQYLKNGLFYENLQRWINHFGSENILTIKIQEIKTSEGIHKIFDFLGIESIEIQNLEANPYKEYRNGFFQFLSKQRKTISHLKKFINFKKIPFLKKMAYVEAEKPIITDTDKAFLTDYYRKDWNLLTSYFEKNNA